MTDSNFFQKWCWTVIPFSPAWSSFRDGGSKLALSASYGNISARATSSRRLGLHIVSPESPVLPFVFYPDRVMPQLSAKSRGRSLEKCVFDQSQRALFWLTQPAARQFSEGRLPYTLSVPTSAYDTTYFAPLLYSIHFIHYLPRTRRLMYGTG